MKLLNLEDDKLKTHTLSKIIFSFFVICLHSATATATATATANEPDMYQYQDLIIRYAELINEQDVVKELEMLSVEGWQLIYDSDKAKDRLAGIVSRLERVNSDVANRSSFSLPIQLATPITVQGEFPPLYPDVDTSSTSCLQSASTCYGAYIKEHTFYLFPIIEDAGGQIGIQDDRCNEHTEAVLKQAFDTRQDQAISAQYVCDASIDGLSVGTCGAASLLWTLARTSEENVGICEFHGGNVDGAEIEASYENSRTTLDQANKILTVTTNLQSILNDETKFTEPASPD